jgi:O-antigen/teichoic acid export membrane protein
MSIAVDVEPPITGRRQIAARGVVINSAFQVGLGALNTLKTVIAAAFLTEADYGVFGILFLAVALIVAVKSAGVTDKFIQQEEEDQEVAFHRAFTLELGSAAILMMAMLLLAPLLALAYGEHELLLPGLACALMLPALALQAPIWISYRQMNFLRQRVLSAVDPISSFVVTIVLAAAGLGYWSLIVGLLAGSWVAAVVAQLTSPYQFRLMFDRSTLREYFHFSWPLMIAGASGLLIGQLSLFFGTIALGLAGAGAIGLAANFSSTADKIDTVITQTIYPAVCRVRQNRTLLKEAFIKSNRLTLMWGMPFGVGLALFASDLIDFGIGHQWDSALLLLQVFGVNAAVNHIGFNWSAFYRATGDTRPIAIVLVATLAAFCASAIPLLFIFGLSGFAVGVGVMTAVSLVLRSYYVIKLFPGFEVFGYLLRAIGPTVPAVVAVLAARGMERGPRTLGIALAELALYIVVTATFTLILERPLIREAIGYLRGRRRPPVVAGT